MLQSPDTISLEEVLLRTKPQPIAYFCAEFAVDQKLPIYAGGLGVLAGDLLYQVSDEQRPYVGVGIFYAKGYVHQEISKEANMMAEDVIDVRSTGLQLITKDGQPVTVTIPVHGHSVKVQCWLKMVGTCPLFLLDTNVEGNSEHEINITDRLYFGDREHRFEQEMVLGFAGFRMLKALGIMPRFYHLNEGHSALLFFELARERCMVDPTVHFSEALKHIGNVVFTNHTLVPAGNDVFSQDLATLYLQSYAMEALIDPHELVMPGLIEDTSLFSPTMLALRLATITQAVSKLHAKKALEIWSHHPMVPVTNGVRQAFWQPSAIAAAKREDDEQLYRAHVQQKKELCTYIQQTTGISWSEHDLILGWSRRIAKYKRPLSIFEDLGRLRTIIDHSPVPIRIVISGKPHMNDEVGLDNLHHILEIVGEFEDHLVYLQNYSLDVARIMLSGIDVLINTPVRGFEACGTSGMKASLCGVLQCTTLDGWTDEVDWNGLGWVLDSEKISPDFYQTLEEKIIPLFGTSAWTSAMRKTIAMAETHYTAARMMQELRDLIYSHIR